MVKKIIRNRHGLRLVTLIQINPRARGLVFVMHGLGGFKEQKHIELVAKTFYERNFTVVRFDTTNSVGESGGAYENATVTNYYQDLEDVIKWARTQPWFQQPFWLTGHSLGGICSILYAQRYPEQVASLIPISPVVSGKLSISRVEKKREYVQWERTGWLIKYSKSKPGLIKRLKWSHMEDRLRYDVLPQAKRLIMPTLLIVGEKDDSTPAEHVFKLYQRLTCQKKFVLIPDAPHTFREKKQLTLIKDIIYKWIGPDLRLKGKRVTVMGLGLHGGGIAAARWAHKRGAHVIVTDLRSRKILAASIKRLPKKNITYVLGKHQMRDFTHTDLVIQNPGVPNYSPYIKAAHQAQVPVENELSIFYRLSKSPIIGVTGTKGKSTVTQLIYEILKHAKKRPLLGGNIRISPFDLLSKTISSRTAVLELSSFQLEDSAQARHSPPIAVVTNILHDHLNRHKTVIGYHNAKKNIFRFQSQDDWTILNYDDPTTRMWGREVPGKRMWFSRKSINEQHAVFVHKRAIFVRINGVLSEVMRLSDCGLRGAHNVSNILAAIAAARISGVSHTIIRKAVIAFHGLSGRMEVIREIQGVAYINDTTATIPDAAIATLKSINSKVVLIAGGADKRLDFNEFVKTIRQHAVWCILLSGSASDKINQLLRKKKYYQCTTVHSMQAAIQVAQEKSVGRYPVVLSPGAASFGMFQNEFDRGDQFSKFVLSIR
ncbi:MAG: UDP-N-acetylmuramoyl-L-alanine--D-glutamate ligase [Candidatus Kerfeldbacteria bacterium]|nr:UDP-N-acetylmuramoyl-L-alanine--D-glutamate ligase [Candidatus Kerfeldbacteria bacterium]